MKFTKGMVVKTTVAYNHDNVPVIGTITQIDDYPGLYATVKDQLGRKRGVHIGFIEKA